MVEKKAAAEGWPIVHGEYETGDAESPVAVITLGSHLGDGPVQAGAGISGPLHTENLGIEKVVANIISNPNIRFLVVCGSEVQGHITGQTMKALYENGIDPEKKNIIGSPGAIPYVENLPVEGIERFQNQLEFVEMIDVEDMGAISSKIKECVEKDPGAFEEDAMVIELEEEGGEEEAGEEVKPVAPETALLEARIRNIQTQVKAVGSYHRLSAGMFAGKVQGIAVGLAFILTLGTILLLK